jgi:hypothetical protein
VIADYGLCSIAVPPLGCGNGGLDWRDVQPLINEALGDLPDLRVLVYPPQNLSLRGPRRTDRRRPPRRLIRGHFRRGPVYHHWHGEVGGQCQARDGR